MNSSKAARNTVRTMKEDEFVNFIVALSQCSLTDRSKDILIALTVGIRNGFGDQ